MNNWVLFLDDLRSPTKEQKEWAETFPNTQLIIARSSKEAKILTLKMGAPIYIFFDHDLGVDDFMGIDTVMFYLDWLIEMYYDADVGYSIHSANPQGAKNIEAKMNSWKKSKTL